MELTERREWAPTERAALSEGGSDDAILDRVVELVASLGPCGTLVDVGCGRGDLAPRLLAAGVRRYVGVDLVRYPGFPGGPGVEFQEADLNRVPYPVPSESADVVVSVETIEHLENPRALVRELVRIAKPGRHVIVTTPNQLSLLSKLTLVVKDQFNAFQEAKGQYPTHITALLEKDLVHIAQECGLTEIRTSFTDQGRIPGVAFHWPARLGFRGRWFSDNVLMLARKPPTAGRG